MGLPLNNYYHKNITMKSVYDIAIIGGGFCGLTAALCLAKANPNLKIALIEKNDIINQQRTRDGRVFAISKKSADLFADIGIEQELKQNAGIIADIMITGSASPFYLHFDGSEVNKKQPFMGLVIESFNVYNALRKAVLEQKNIKLICPAYYQDVSFCEEYAKVILDDNQLIKAKLLIATDGRNSPLRQKFNIRTFEKSYNQAAIVFNITHQKPHNNIAWEKFLPQGPFAILPMHESNQSSIIWTVKSDMADAIISLDQENFLQQLNKRIGDSLGDIKVSASPFRYDLNLITANSYFFGRMVLVGDSAHAIHPIAGQGFNLGVSDIAVLTDLVKEHFECGLDIGDSILLESYQRARKLSASKMILATDGLNDLFSNNILPVKWIRELGLAAVEKFPELKKFFIRNAGGN